MVQEKDSPVSTTSLESKNLSLFDHDVAYSSVRLLYSYVKECRSLPNIISQCEDFIGPVSILSLSYMLNLYSTFNRFHVMDVTGVKFNYVRPYVDISMKNPMFTDISGSSTLIFDCQTYLKLLVSKGLLTEEETWPAFKFFVACMYVVVMSIQEKKHALVVGRYHKSGRFINYHTDVIVPQVSSVDDSTGNHAYLSRDLIGSYLDYLMYIPWTFDESDIGFIPKHWTHPYVSSDREYPTTEYDWVSSLDYVSKNKRFALIVEGDTATCPKEWSIRTILFRERLLLGLRSLRSLFCKVIFEDETEAIVIFNLEAKTLVYSSHSESNNEAFLNLLTHIYVDMTCVRQDDREFRIKTNMQRDKRDYDSSVLFSTTLSEKESYISIPRYCSNPEDSSASPKSVLDKAEEVVVERGTSVVGGHVFKLREGQKASKEARQAALDVGIDLPPTGWSYKKQYIRRNRVSKFLSRRKSKRNLKVRNILSETGK